MTATLKNQISGFCYDAAGNLLIEGPCGPTLTYQYDAENRMTTTAGVTYTYDGDGRRVKKSTGKLYWYGASGLDALLETDLAGNTPTEFVFFGGKRIARRDSSGSISYFFADHLGSSRVLTNSSGTVVEDSDFYPFGGERAVVNGDPNTYKFTGKERDTESNLDYFPARLYTASLGRFLKPDPFSLSAKFGNPQSWNRYAYARNNPLRLVDPTGLSEQGAGTSPPPRCQDQTDGKECTVVIDPGHGDKPTNRTQVDPGAVAGGEQEKDLVAAIAKATVDYLSENTVVVSATRSGDIENPGPYLQWRRDFADKVDAGVFVSIHANSATNANASGMQVYLRSDGRQLQESLDLADSIASANTVMSSATVRQQGAGGRLGVLGGSNLDRRAVLVEVGFITNASDRQEMRSQATRIGQEIGQGIVNYLRSQRRP